MAKGMKAAGLVLLGLVIVFAAFLGHMLIPRDDPRALPASLIALTSEEGRRLLREADAIEDYDELSRNFEAQNLTSFCGVASSVAVLNALGRPVSQTSLFDGDASAVRPIWRVAVRGMTLDVIAGLLRANGATVGLHRADADGLSEFRRAVVRNLSTDDDYLVVNYQRAKLGQEPVGHISPVSAYDKETDRVLVMDTAAYKYPKTWVPVAGLYSAMATTDSESGLSRGWLEVGKSASSVAQR